MSKLPSMNKFTYLLIHVNRYKYVLNTQVYSHQHTYAWIGSHTSLIHAHTFTPWHDHAQRFTHTGGDAYVLTDTCSFTHSDKQLVLKPTWPHTWNAHTFTHSWKYAHITTYSFTHTYQHSYIYWCVYFNLGSHTLTCSLTNTNMVENWLAHVEFHK